MSISVLTFTYIWKGPSNFVGTGGDQFKMGLGEAEFGCQVRVCIRSRGARRRRWEWSGPGGGEGDYHASPSPTPALASPSPHPAHCSSSVSHKSVRPFLSPSPADTLDQAPSHLDLVYFIGLHSSILTSYNPVCTQQPRWCFQMEIWSHHHPAQNHSDVSCCHQAP